MNKQIFVFSLFVLAMKPVSAETCFSYEETSLVDSSANVESIQKMQGNLPQSAAVKKMMAELEKSNRPEVTKSFMSSRYFVSAFPSGYSVFDYQKGSMLSVMHDQKIFVSGTISDFSNNPMSSHSMPPGYKSIETKTTSKKTGKTMVIAGVSCEEYETTTKTQYPGQNFPGGKSIGMEQKRITCEAATEPALYFKLKKSHETLFISSLPAGVKLKIEAAAQAKKAERWILSDEMKMGSVAGSSAPVPTGKRIVQSIGNTCPPANYLKAPAGYKQFNAQLPRLGR